MRHYAICITDNESTGEMGVNCANKTDARNAARLYIRQWRLHGAKIEYIRELETDEKPLPYGRYTGIIK